MRRDGNDHDDDLLEIDLAPSRTRSRWGSRLAVLAGLAGLVGVGAVAVWFGAGSESTRTENEEALPEPDADQDTVVVEVQYGGRFTGVDSLRLPLLVSPDDGLVDGQAVALVADGFAPSSAVGIVQCAGAEGNPRGEGSCDIGNYILANTDENGHLVAEFHVRRFISNAAGEIDCAAPGELACAIAVANISDYDESAVGRVWFDPSVEGVRAPTVTVDRTEALVDGDILAVSGTNFPPGEPVIVSQCVIGGSHSIISCWDDPFRRTETVASADGTFEIAVAVDRVLNERIDCFADPYGCRIAARTTTNEFTLGDGSTANPVRLLFDGNTLPSDLEWGIAYSLNPDRDLIDGEEILLRLGNLERSPCEEGHLLLEDPESEDLDPNICEPVTIQDGEVEVSQCADLAAGEEYCTEPITIDIVNGTAEVTVTLQREFVRPSDPVIDCAEPGRQCELRITGDIDGYVPLRFSPD